MHNRPTTLLLNIGHALDHMFLLIFATAVTSIATDFGVERWEDLMPYSVAAFFFFGIGSIPAGRLGDLWGRRQMMVIFFIGVGLASVLVSFTNTPFQLWCLLVRSRCLPMALPKLAFSPPFAAATSPVGLAAC
jgi:MFS family permease